MRATKRARRLFFGTFVLVLSGCATIQPLGISSRKPVFRKPSVEISYQDYTGIFHVHSRYSHDSKGRFDEIVKATEKAYADFVVITDHNTLQGLHEKMDGFYGETLVIIGNEVSTSAGHLAILGIEKEIDRDKAPEGILKEVHESGGLSFVCHGESKRTPWRDWSVSPLTGMEIYNLAGDVYEEGAFWVTLKVIGFYPRLFFRSIMNKPRLYLDRWDELLRKGKVVGIGAVDAHQKIRFLGRPIDHYDSMFKVVQTHAWAESLSKDSILKAFEKGHVYVGFDIVAPVRNFLFVAESPKGKVIMGDSIKNQDDLKLRIFLPKKGDIRLLKDGSLWKRGKAVYLETAADGRGVYRVEVYHGKRLWIVSNPIYVTS